MPPIPFSYETTGVVIVDHGSRREESNLRLLDLVELFRKKQSYKIVEPAHMELAEPSIEQAFAACIDQGAESIVVSPFFLLPGRHWQDDIPQLSAAASKAHNSIPFMVSSPLGIHDKLVEVLSDHISFCLNSADSDLCSNCSTTKKCR